MIGKKQLFLKVNEETVSDIFNMSGVSAKTLKIQPQVTSSINSSFQSVLEEILVRLQKLETLVVTSENFGSRTRNRSRTPSRLRSHSPSNNNICWYHIKYGRLATKCQQPCIFSNKKLGEGQQTSQ